jgi:hypothetical protein
MRQVSRWGQRWPDWVAYAASAWALAYSVVWLERAWLVAGLLLACAVLAAGTTRPRTRRPLANVVLAGVWTSAAAATVGGFGLVMSLVELASTGRVTGPDGDVGWARLVDQGACALGALLLVGTALSWRHRLRGTCPRCGGRHPLGAVLEVVRPAPAAAPRGVCLVATAGIACFVPYVAAKTALGLGGTVAGLSADDVGDYTGMAGWLQERGVDVTAILAVFGVLLLVGLTSRWGAARPRMLLLAPGWLGAATLAPYGTGRLVAVPFLASGAVEYDAPVSLWWFVLGGAFGPYGLALAVAALSYQRRTRGRCVIGRPGRPPSRLAASLHPRPHPSTEELS